MENSYFSEDHGIHQIKVNKPKSRSVSIPTFIISLIMVAALVIIIFLKWDDIMGFFGIEQEIENTEESQLLSVGDEVKFSGSIRADGDMENYTHSYVSSEYGVIGLKSKSVTLNDYSDNVYFEGVVEKIYREIPIVLVTTIYSMEFDDVENTGDDSQTGENMEPLDKYLPSLGLYFSEDFFQKYSLVNEGDGSLLKIKDLETNIIHSINYFKCDTKPQSSENCEYLRDFYSTTSNSSLVDKYGVSYYKDAESSSWFFSNDSVFGYKINNEDESFMRDLSTLMTVVNKKYVEKNVSNNISKLCSLGHTSIQKITDSNISYKNGELWYYVTGTDANENIVTCELKINPSLSNNAQVTNIEITDKTEGTIDEDKQEETDKDDENIDKKDEESAKIWDPSVEQFPINLEKKLTFTSSRGHSFVFPSSNIAYQGVSAEEDFGQVGVNCFSAMNVVKYPDKEFVETQPSVIIYECTVKNSFDDSDNTLIYKHVGDKHFVIKIVDSAWVDFANNIEIIA